MKFNMYMPTRIVFGSGRLNELHKQKMPGKKALIIISSGKSVLNNGALARVEAELQKAGVTFSLFNQIDANPTESSIMAGAKSARDNGCDFVVALGGGSVLDASKVIAMMAANEGDLWDYVQAGSGKRQSIKSDPLPVICITTTAGTGSEVDPWGVVTNEETNEKIGVDSTMYPVIAIVDPELMVTVPPKYTAFQGFDALLQVIETYIAKFANPMSDMYSLTAIENAGQFLVRAVKDGNDLEARERMAFANTLSGVAMTISSTTAEHSLEHAMSAYHPSLPHGAGLIMISKAFFEFFIEKHACDDRFVRIAQALGMKNASKPEDFITVLTNLQQECGVADLKMSDYGITPDEFDTLAKNARETMGSLFEANPCEMTQEDCVAVLRKSYR